MFYFEQKDIKSMSTGGKETSFMKIYLGLEVPKKSDTGILLAELPKVTSASGNEFTQPIELVSRGIIMFFPVIITVCFIIWILHR